MNVDYKDYTVEDFASDEFFVRWVKSSDKDTSVFWDKWLAAHPQKQKEIRQAKQLVESVKYKKRLELEDEMYIEVFENISKSSYGSPQSTTSYLSFFKRNWFQTLAAMLLLTFLIRGLYIGITPAQEQVISKTNWITKEIPFGKKTTLKLSDGSLVKLNSGSMLHFPESFPKDADRIVYLEGEAFFDVVEDTSRPFVIHSSSLTTTVKGTSFDIKAYPDEENIAVSVVTGLVEVTNNIDKKIIELRPNEKVVYNDEEKVLNKVHFDLSEISWQEGIIIFDKADLKEIIKQLERWYGVKFIVKNTKLLSKQGYTERFENASLKSVMETISFAGGFQYSIIDNNVTIK